MRTDMNNASRPAIAPLLLAISLGASSLMSAPSAFALSELQKTPTASDGTSTDKPPSAPDASSGVPAPGPVISKPAGQSPDTTPGAQDSSKPVEVLYDISKVPEPVRHMREQIVEAAASGDLERLRPLFGTGATQTQVSVGEATDDPIGALKDLSGDPDGDEILAIILDIISTGFVHVGQGTPDEMYVWPYFAEKDLKKLTPPERVELLRIVTAGDLADMQEFGGYNFYRLGITADGKWKFFTAGD
ncbi:MULTISPECIES: hypothetical protein [unclassified Rhizobium]|jgi:hypothetical protein|uniref:hypothetical protein n=1 Tax=unclassified Rhizobium TaxID=2613769 RepID=UPI000370C0D6|nr:MULTISPECIES: hypothetical protein [unclassified Rhizobium]MBO9123320.1 hypothetical protein [Rhizobium sp. 16-488-2b]MBO9173852.1 hypothetical protein [Rhizobium sp. 16-488-2a]MDM9648401.1 hypothetical protein [Rhizobium sp. S163]